MVVFQKNYGLTRQEENTTVTYSYGNDFVICATSVAILSWLRYYDKYEVLIENGIKYIYSQCSGGRFGSTHSTILALKAINKFQDTIVVQAKDLIKIDYYYDKKLIGSHEMKLDVEQLALPLDVKYLSPGKKSKFSIKMDGTKQLSFTAQLNFRNLLPDNNANCSLNLETSLGKTKINEGEGTEVKVKLTNLDKEKGLPMSVVLVGLPGGLEARFKHLKELVESKTIDYFEIKNRWVILYFLEMDVAQEREVNFDVIASFPGNYMGESSITYLYYTDDFKYYAEPLSIKISPQH